VFLWSELRSETLLRPLGRRQGRQHQAELYAIVGPAWRTGPLNPGRETRIVIHKFEHASAAPFQGFFNLPIITQGSCPVLCCLTPSGFLGIYVNSYGIEFYIDPRSALKGRRSKAQGVSPGNVRPHKTALAAQHLSVFFSFDPRLAYNDVACNPGADLTRGSYGVLSTPLRWSTGSTIATARHAKLPLITGGVLWRTPGRS